MSHRNENLVFTNDDICNTSSDTVNKTTKRKLTDEPRRSQRLINKKQKIVEDIDKPTKKIIIDLTGDDTSDTDEIINESTSDSDSEMDIVESDDNNLNDKFDDLIIRNHINEPIRNIPTILHPNNFRPNSLLENEYDDNDVMDELINENWFHELSGRNQKLYIEKLKKVMTYKEKIPTMKDILDMDIGNDNVKRLIYERKRLDEYDKLTLEYEYACNNFLKLVASLSNKSNMKNQADMKKIETKIMDQDKFSQSLRDRILKSDFNDTIKSIIYDKYIIMCSSDSDEAAKYKTWLETILAIPHKPKIISIDQTIPKNEAISKLISVMMEQLNKKVYGMIEAKEELLCIIANMIVNPKSKHKAIGLYGPPGIGKTMIVGVIAEVLGLPMEQIALGGVTDSSFLEGHGFTYVGSGPGCIVKSLTKMGCTNGIMYLDEVDKISRTEKGKEIEHSLLHITDFTQNHDFRDKYISEIPIDLSDLILVYSMNTINELDTALASRIPVIKFDGYTKKEKCDIVKDFLLPELLRNYHLTSNDIIIQHSTIGYLVDHVKEDYTSNSTSNSTLNSTKSGVRGLKKILNRILCRINLYKLASVNGKINIDLSFNIPNFQLPYVLSTNFIDKIISSSSEESGGNHSYQHMYT